MEAKGVNTRVAGRQGGKRNQLPPVRMKEPISVCVQHARDGFHAAILLLHGRGPELDDNQRTKTFQGPCRARERSIFITFDIQEQGVKPMQVSRFRKVVERRDCNVPIRTFGYDVGMARIASRLFHCRLAGRVGHGKRVAGDGA